MMQQRPRRRRTFSIAGLLLLMSVISLHFAFPFLLYCLGLTFGWAVILFFVAFLPMYFGAAIFSDQVGNQLDVANNPGCRLIAFGYLSVICLIYIGMVVFHAWSRMSNQT